MGENLEQTTLGTLLVILATTTLCTFVENHEIHTLQIRTLGRDSLGRKYNKQIGSSLFHKTENMTQLKLLKIAEVQ